MGDGYFNGDLSLAYNDYFMCVLPPKENMLDIEIRAAEKNFR